MTSLQKTTCQTFGNSFSDWNVLKTSVPHKIHHKESKKLNSSEQTLNSFKFRIGDPCYAKVFSTKSEKSPKWIPAVITKVFGTRSCNIKVIRANVEATHRVAALAIQQMWWQRRPAVRIPNLLRMSQSPQSSSQQL